MTTRFLILFFQHLGFLFLIGCIGQLVSLFIQGEALAETTLISLLVIAILMAFGSTLTALHHRIDGVRIILKAKPEAVPMMLKHGFKSVQQVSDRIWLVGNSKKDWRVELVASNKNQVELHFTSRKLFNLIQRTSALKLHTMTMALNQAPTYDAETETTI